MAWRTRKFFWKKGEPIEIEILAWVENGAVVYVHSYDKPMIPFFLDLTEIIIEYV